MFVAAAAEIRKRQGASGGAGEGQWPFRLRAKMLQQQQQQQQRGRSGDLALLRKNGGENAEDEAAAASDSLAALDGGAAMKLGAHFLTLKFSGPMPEGFVGGQRAGGGGPEVEGGDDDEPGEEQGQLNAIAAAAAATKRLNIAALPPHSLARGRLVAAFRKELGLRIFGGDVSDGASGAARIRVLGLRAGSVVVCFEFTEVGEVVPYVAEANVGERGDDEERAEEGKAEEGGEGGAEEGGAEEGGAAAGSEAADGDGGGDGGGDAAADDEAGSMSRADAEARLKELLLQGQLHDGASAEASAYKLLPMLDSRDPAARHLRHRLREGRAAASAAGSGGTLKLLLRVPLVQVGVLKKGSAARAKVRPLAAAAGC